MPPKLLGPQKQWKKDQRDLAAHQRDARKEFRAVLEDLKPLTEQVWVLFPDAGDLPRKQRSRAWTKEFNTSSFPKVRAFLDTFLGSKVKIGDLAGPLENSTLGLLKGVSLGVKGINEALSSLDALTEKGFQAMVMAEVQSPLRQALPARLREFLPDNIVVDVDKDGYISRVTDRFENERLTLGAKIERMKIILSQYNEIVKKVKKDLKSTDETTRLSALITAIIMETGIRPGAAGNSTIEIVNGEKVEVETFGATTLGPGHVRFVRDNFAAIEFIGKMGSVNTTSLSDHEIIKVLEDYVKKALKTGSKFVFVTSDGTPYSYTDLQLYFRHNFKGISPTDFRKLKATETVLSSLREQQEALYAQIRGFAQSETEDLKERIVEALVATLDAAIAQAAVALSHDDAKTTKGHYIDPQVLLHFLSTGRASDSLQGAVLGGRTQLTFDPMTFAQIAGVKAVAAAFSRKSKATLLSIMEALEEDLKAI